MRRELAAVYDELKRRQLNGEKSVYLKDDVLDYLRQTSMEPVAEKAPQPENPREKPMASKKRKSPEVEIPAAPSVTLPEGDSQARLDSLRKQVMEDSWCQSQVKPGKKVVFGVGNPEARIFFCGEAPGAEEEVQGEPFVGPAGQLLTRIIKTMGLSREEVYIANIMKYRPPMPGSVGNRPPTEAEMTYCIPFLLAQLDIIQPEVVVALGKTAVEGLLGPDPKRRMTKIRGQWNEFQGIPLMPTFHPSYLLRNQSLGIKRQVWEDMLSIMDRLEMNVTEKQRGFFLK